MPRRRDEQPRVHKPAWIESEKRWRVRTVDPGAACGRGRKTDRRFDRKSDADDWYEKVKAEVERLKGVTVSEAIGRYTGEGVASGRQLATSAALLAYKLGLFFKPVADGQISRITPAKAEQLYVTFRAGRSVDYHRNTLGNARGFMDWCVKQGLASVNPFAGVQGVGRRSRGKLQLTGDEARKFYETALVMAREEDRGALGAVMLLLMGLRNSEVSRRRVRDLDLQGTVLRVTKAKTKKGDRVVPVPPALRGYLLELVEHRFGNEVLFPAVGEIEHTRAWLHAAVKRVCKRAGVTVVCPHGLRGTHTTLGVHAGVGTRAVADALGHVSDETTKRHYIGDGAHEDATAARAAAVISGSESGSLPN